MVAKKQGEYIRSVVLVENESVAIKKYIGSKKEPENRGLIWRKSFDFVIICEKGGMHMKETHPFVEMILIRFFVVVILVGSFTWFIYANWHPKEATDNVKAHISTSDSHLKEILTLEELEQYLGISKVEISKLTRKENGDGLMETNIPVIMIEGKNYYPRKAIDKWLENIQLIKVSK